MSPETIDMITGPVAPFLLLLALLFLLGLSWATEARR